MTSLGVDSNKENDPLLVCINIDLVNFSKAKKQEHVFETTLSYKEFDDIFVRTCIAFITKYIREH